MAKPTPPALATLSSRIISESYRPTDEEIKSMAASLVEQAEPPDESLPGPNDVVNVVVGKFGVQRSIVRGVR